MTDQRTRVRDGYDTLAADYDDQRSADPPATLDALTDRLDPDDRVLDAGCGGGKPVLTRLDADYPTVGLDFSAAQLDIARGRTDGPLVRGDVTHLPFERSSFDAVTCLYTIIHLPLDDHPAVLGEFARVLRSGGWLLLTSGDEAWTGHNDDWLDTGVRMEWSYPTADETRGTLREHGFEIEEEWPNGHPDGGDFPFLLARYEG
ncbi:class I SAM-dependent methyltransferase [Halomarina litorea]|uniref:class I SAM-dependent methyltransferase n=1 Tax=Halomarina litorea TaxID=2961595 RepID=UPI0020C473D7|nr:class I SAM-dependent methyltransferase [Halomarina sp. BCD28]